MKVYLVASGEYSDYSIEAVSLDRKVAKAIVDRINAAEHYGSDARIETRELYDKASSLELITYYRVEVSPDGTEQRRWITTHHPWDGYIQETWGNATYSAAASPRGFDVALKAARDRAYKLQAKKAGIADA
jgi:hypothetical protein